MGLFTRHDDNFLGQKDGISAWLGDGGRTRISWFRNRQPLRRRKARFTSGRSCRRQLRPATSWHAEHEPQATISWTARTSFLRDVSGYRKLCKS